MRIPWVPLLLGLGCCALGAWLMLSGWAAVEVGDTASASASLAGGALLAMLGVLMVAVPLLAPLLYRIYGPEAFTSRGGACPVVAKCARCGEFTFRGKPACKACGTALGPQGS